ncbi:hypothetical protein Tco_1446746 [Tanacetum coccineum]
MKKKKLSQGASTSGIFTIELYSFPSTSWVYDTGCGTHICITTQGLRGSRKLKPGALSLYVGDGHRAAVEAIGDFHLCLPSGLVLILHNYVEYIAAFDALKKAVWICKFIYRLGVVPTIEEPIFVEICIVHNTGSNSNNANIWCHSKGASTIFAEANHSLSCETMHGDDV